MQHQTELRNWLPNSQAFHRLPSATETSAGSLVQFKLCMILSFQLQMLLGDGEARVKKHYPVYTVGEYMMTCTTVQFFQPSLYRPTSPNLSWTFHPAPSAEMTLMQRL